MSVDRLQELKNLQSGGFPAFRNPAAYDYEAQTNNPEDPDGDEEIEEEGDDLQEFSTSVNQAQGLLKAIAQNLEKQKTILTSAKASANTANDNLLSKEFKDLTEKNRHSLDQTKVLLTKLKEDYERAASEAADDPSTRFKEAKLISLTSQYSELISSAQGASLDFKNFMKDRVKRDYKIAMADDRNKMDDEKLNDMMETNPEKLKQEIKQKMGGVIHTRVQNALQDIEDKCDEISRLKDNVVRLYEMQKDIKDLVMEQGQRVDMILANVSKGKDYMEKGNKHLVQAKEDHGKARKKQCCLILIAVVILAIILLPVLTTMLA